MKCLLPMVFCILTSTALIAQNQHQPETFRGLTNREVVSDTLPGMQHIKDHVAGGKIKLSLHDAIEIALENNTGIRVQQLQIQTAKYGLLAAHQPFDPFVQAQFDAVRSTIPTTTSLAGAPTVSSLSHTGAINYFQTFETGTSFVGGITSSRLSTNSAFNFLNPAYTSAVNLSFTQSLLRNRWTFASQAPLVIGRRNIKQSRANLEAQVSDTVLNVVGRYWDVVQARGNLEVQQQSLQAAEASYNRDKRALELGALPPLDIYRSEAEVAARRVGLIQGEYAVKQAEDALRYILGMNIDSAYRAFDLGLTENPEPQGELRSTDVETTLQQALAQRPEFEAVRQALANDDTSIRLAHNNMLPDLHLSGTYSSNGTGGNQYDIALTPPVLISLGGLGQSFSQVFGFGFPTYGVTLALNFPLRNRGAEADLGNALVSRKTDLYRDRSLREQITLEVGNAVHALEQAKLSLAASKLALDLAQKNLAAEQRKYELGSSTIFFVLDAQSQVAQAQARVLQAEVGYQVSLAQIDHATGQLLSQFNILLTELSK